MGTPRWCPAADITGLIKLAKGAVELNRHRMPARPGVAAEAETNGLINGGLPQAQDVP